MVDVYHLVLGRSGLLPPLRDVVERPITGTATPSMPPSPCPPPDSPTSLNSVVIAGHGGEVPGKVAGGNFVRGRNGTSGCGEDGRDPTRSGSEKDHILGDAVVTTGVGIAPSEKDKAERDRSSSSVLKTQEEGNLSKTVSSPSKSSAQEKATTTTRPRRYSETTGFVDVHCSKGRLSTGGSSCGSSHHRHSTGAQQPTSTAFYNGKFLSTAGDCSGLGGKRRFSGKPILPEGLGRKKRGSGAEVDLNGGRRKEPRSVFGNREMNAGALSASTPSPGKGSSLSRERGRKSRGSQLSTPGTEGRTSKNRRSFLGGEENDGQHSSSSTPLTGESSSTTSMSRGYYARGGTSYHVEESPTLVFSKSFEGLFEAMKNPPTLKTPKIKWSIVILEIDAFHKHFDLKTELNSVFRGGVGTCLP